jgi:hypothetical protein
MKLLMRWVIAGTAAWLVARQVGVHITMWLERLERELISF